MKTVLTPLVDRIAAKIAAPSPLVLDPWWEDPQYRLLAPFLFDRTAHWTWTGAYSRKRGSAYGQDRPVIRTGGKGSPIAYVFRILLALKDQVPLSRRTGLDAAHDPACSLPSCVNPWHGYWATPARNREDRERYARETFTRRAARSRKVPC